MAQNQRRLFRVSFQGQDHFFQYKQAAKKFGREQGLKGAVVHRGPDHWLGDALVKEKGAVGVSAICGNIEFAPVLPSEDPVS